MSDMDRDGLRQDPIPPRISPVDTFEMVSVVMPVLNAAKTIPDQLAALAAQTYEGDWELVVADNGSSDGSDAIVQTWADRLPSLRVVYALERKGCSYARNVGAKAARGDFILACDADDVVTPRWLEIMVEKGRGCPIVGGGLDQVTLNTDLARSWRPPLPADGLPVALGFLPYAVGANCGMRKEVFQALGGWNERLALCGDDVELSWRAQLASYPICFAPDAVVLYRFRDRPGATARQFFNYGRMEPRLFRCYRHQGMQRSGLKTAFRDWAWIAVHIGDLFKSAERKGVWMRKAAYRRGRLVGSIREGVLYL